MKDVEVKEKKVGKVTVAKNKVKSVEKNSNKEREAMDKKRNRESRILRCRKRRRRRNQARTPEVVEAKR